MLMSMLAIGSGAALGAILRWRLGEAFNSLYPAIPPGTLIANLLGGYIIGIALSVFDSLPGISPHWRLFTISGFLGALTTFSTFSAEVAALLREQRICMAAGEIVLHVFGTLTAFFLGIGTIRIIWHLLGAQK